jgi:hypothetical protein
VCSCSLSAGWGDIGYVPPPLDLTRFGIEPNPGMAALIPSSLSMLRSRWIACNASAPHVATPFECFDYIQALRASTTAASLFRTDFSSILVPIERITAGAPTVYVWTISYNNRDCARAWLKEKQDAAMENAAAWEHVLEGVEAAARAGLSATDTTHHHYFGCSTDIAQRYDRDYFLRGLTLVHRECRIIARSQNPPIRFSFGAVATVIATGLTENERTTEALNMERELGKLFGVDLDAIQNKLVLNRRPLGESWGKFAPLLRNQSALSALAAWWYSPPTDGESSKGWKDLARRISEHLGLQEGEQNQDSTGMFVYKYLRPLREATPAAEVSQHQMRHLRAGHLVRDTDTVTKNLKELLLCEWLPGSHSGGADMRKPSMARWIVQRTAAGQPPTESEIVQLGVAANTLRHAGSKKQSSALSQWLQTTNAAERARIHPRAISYFTGENESETCEEGRADRNNGKLCGEPATSCTSCLHLFCSSHMTATGHKHKHYHQTKRVKAKISAAAAAAHG